MIGSYVQRYQIHLSEVKFDEVGLICGFSP